MAELRKYKTIDEQLAVIEDHHLENIARKLWFLGDDEGGPKVDSNVENGYWSEDSELGKLTDVVADNEECIICDGSEEKFVAIIGCGPLTADNHQ